MLIDSHCHLDRLDLSAHQGSLAAALDAARAAGVQQFLAVAVDLDDHGRLMAIAREHPGVGISVGVHPCENLTMLQRATVETLCELGQAEEVWAIGETGLDYHYSDELKAAQQQSFAHHIQASQQLGKPVIVHCREARADTLAILREQEARHGILHCFTEDWDTARAALELGLYISFSGIISFKNAQPLRDVLAQVPLDRLLIETDSPYLAPVPWRGKPNEPAYLPGVLRVVAEVRGLDEAEVAACTTANFMALRQAAAQDGQRRVHSQTGEQR